MFTTDSVFYAWNMFSHGLGLDVTFPTGHHVKFI